MQNLPFSASPLHMLHQIQVSHFLRLHGRVLSAPPVPAIDILDLSVKNRRHINLVKSAKDSRLEIPPTKYPHITKRPYHFLHESYFILLELYEYAKL